MFASIKAFFVRHFTAPKTVASAIAPLTKIAADLSAVHATASADVAAAHKEIDAKLAQAETHYDTIDAAAAHLVAVKSVLGAVAPAQAVANVTNTPVVVVTPAVTK